MDVIVIDGGADGPVVGRLNDDDTITVVRDVPVDQPEYGQVSIEFEGETWHTVYSDYDQGLFTVVRAAGHWSVPTRSPNSTKDWIYANPARERVRFTGRQVCIRCLHHHDHGEGACPP